MTRREGSMIPADFPALPGLTALEAVTVTTTPQPDTEAIGYTVFVDGDVPAALGLDRDALARAGFEAKVGQTLVVPAPSGADLVAVGAGSSSDLTVALLRDLAAAFTRATSRRSRLTLIVESLPAATDADAAAVALVEGALLARYAYTPLASRPTHTALHTLVLQISGVDAEAIARGAAEAFVAARATIIARDLAKHTRASPWQCKPAAAMDRANWR